MFSWSQPHWARLKKALHKKYPDIINTPGGPPAVKARLAEASLADKDTRRAQYGLQIQFNSIQ